MTALVIPDLGKYAVAVLSAYGVSILLLVLLVGGSILASRRAAKALKAAEARRGRG